VSLPADSRPMRYLQHPRMGYGPQCAGPREPAKRERPGCRAERFPRPWAPGHRSRRAMNGLVAHALIRLARRT